MLDLWRNHWHCILPMAAVCIAAWVMQRREDKRDDGQHKGGGSDGAE